MLQWGRPFRVMATPPNGSSEPVERFNLLHCYYIAPPNLGVPRCGWTAGSADLLWDGGRLSRVWMVGPAEILWTVRTCP
jgi:hypothetical protein